ncbi:DsbA family protein [Pleomorphomonas sp. NRK KF1]|uniref:DsbA family protein n=1 Tax=Pleomorphomonas sp. NRK KF1 TaxID=2943000 RepID=UPI002043E614|nr:DsbA family protein [Pleomorphomonas sp. NRK KF1]MCM5553943.1 DsbA family protein [Pleomorphomonas sp. NRK KF1]
MRITYLFDPLCGWCYGAAPALDQLSAIEGVTVQLAPTGLFAGENARPMDASFAAYAWQNDQRISRLTGQTFSDSYRVNVLGATGGLFDSAPATLGVVAVALTEPKRAFEALKALQRARYVEGLDNSSLQVVSEVLSREGFAEAARRVLEPDAELLAAYRARIDAARREMARFGAQGVPTLVVEDESGSRLLPTGALFGDIEALTAQLRAARLPTA